MVLVTNGQTMNTAETWTWIDSKTDSHWQREPLGDVALTLFLEAMAYDPSSQTVLLVTPSTPDDTASVALGWNGKAWHVLNRNGPAVDAMAYYPADNLLLACSSATYSASVEVQSDCWEWTGSMWMQKVVAVPPPELEADHHRGGDLRHRPFAPHRVRLAHPRDPGTAAATARLVMGRRAVVIGCSRGCTPLRHRAWRRW